MPILIPGVPEKLTYAVAASIGVTVVTAILAGAGGLVVGGLIALALAGVTYWYVYRSLAGNVATAKMAALVVAIVHAFFAIVSISLHIPLFFLLDAISAGCLLYAFLQLQRATAWPLTRAR
jgi:hypothetical protein